MDDRIEEASAEIAGQKFKVIGANLNTLFTIMGFVVTCLIAYVLWTHLQDSREANANFVTAIKEQTIVQKEGITVAREQNCLMVSKDAELCRRLSR